MRIVGLVFGLLVTLSMAAAALNYVPGYIGQQRIYVQDWRSSPDQRAYHGYGYPDDANPDSARTGPGKPDFRISGKAEPKQPSAAICDTTCRTTGRCGSG